MKRDRTVELAASVPNRADAYRMQGLFRFILALMVLWSHSVPTFFPELGGWFLKLQLGNVAVSAFFVLSGYLMSEAIAIWYSGRLFQFIANRYLRISPPLFVAAVVSVAVHFALLRGGFPMVGIEEIPKEAISQRSAIMSLLDPLFPLNIPIGKLLGILPQPNAYAFVRYAWAIFTEMIFYWTLVAYFVTAHLLGMRVATFIFLLAVFFMFVLGNGNYNGLFGETAAAGLIARIPFIFHAQWAPHFLVGLMLSRCARDGWRSFNSLAILIAAGLMAIIQLSLYVGQDVSAAIWPLSLYVLTLTLGFLVILSSRREYAFGPLRFTAKLDQSFGNLSYPIYINQFALALAILSILTYLTGTNAGGMPIALRLPLFIGFNLLIIGIAAVLIHLTDTLTDRLRDRLRGAAISRPH